MSSEVSQLAACAHSLSAMDLYTYQIVAIQARVLLLWAAILLCLEGSGTRGGLEIVLLPQQPHPRSALHVLLQVHLQRAGSASRKALPEQIIFHFPASVFFSRYFLTFPLVPTVCDMN